ncbi:Tad domain-containing protein [Streptomyces sp. ISL-43]|uniref:Tad domain-containing protein n=1 Tax=Streptomyces sp. ISL-43 TaxID=2819183 RepID=UPI001BED0A8C|nr:Tad domain-containing protein [Streptomyces sp. ISL-43]MBT2446005.1 Tad domain-containing protein [Streptomyces sp. ISL-43]
MSGPDGLKARLKARGAELDDRGSGAGALIIFSILFLALAAFVVDGGMAISQRERAADIAEQAARFAAQDIDRAALYAGSGGAPINFQNCDRRVRRFAEESKMALPDVNASYCVSASARQVQVEIQLTYKPVLGLYHRGPVTVRGRAVAESVTG